MHFKPKKFLSLLTASLLAAGGLVGVAAAPAFADATAPATYVDYENKTHVSCGGCLGYEDTNLSNQTPDRDNSTWGDYVNDGPTGGDASFGTMMIKGTKGNTATSSITIAELASTSSAVSSTTRTVTMKFKAIASGKSVRLDLKTDNYGATISSTANEQTTGAWQTLTFVFSAAENYALAYNRASVFYDPNSTVGISGDMYIDNVSFNGGIPTPPPVALTAVSTLLDFTSGLHTLVNFDNSSATVATPPTSATGCSPALKVSKAVIGWSGTEYALSRVARFSDRKLTSSANSVMTVNMYAPEAGKKVFFKIGRNGVNAGVDYEFTVVTPGWQRMSIDFGPIQSAGSWNATWSSSHEYTDLFIGVDFRGAGTGQNYYFDDIAFNGETTPALGSVVSCEPKPSKYIWSPYFDEDKKGFYPHVRLEKSFLNEKLDGTWWDGVWQNRDADTRAYLKYIPVGSTFSLTYHVTNEYGAPYVGAKVSLIVNANYSCAKTFFAYEGSLIGPDDCAGGGETELPAKTVDADGRVTFVLTNTNTTGEAMPVDLNGAPNPATKEVGTNIKPNVVGAKQQGIDMLFAHFVEPSGMSKATGPAAKTATIGSGEVSEFALTDDAGKPLSNTDVKYFVNGFDSKAGFARTDAAGKVRIHSTNSAGLEGLQTVGVSLVRDGKLPLAATATINWMAPELSIAAAGAANSVVVKVAGAAGKTVKITIAGKVYTRVANSAVAEFTIATGAGKKAVKVSVPGKSLSKSVTVTRK